MSNRTYSAAFNEQKSAPGFNYIYDPNAFNSGNPNATGAWRPYSTSDISNNTVNVSGLNLSVGNVAVTGGAIAISNTPNVVPVGGFVGLTGTPTVNVTNPVLATSGIVTVLSLPTQNVAVTGGSIQTIVTGTIGGTVQVNSVAITGAPVVTLTGFTQVIVPSGVNVNNIITANVFNTLNTTGTSLIINTAPIPISGVVQAQVSIGNVAVTGGSIQTITTGSFTATIGNVAVTGGSINIGNTSPIPISGVVQATLQATSVAVTGGAINATLVGGSANLVNSGGYVGITGSVNVGNLTITGGTINVLDQTTWALLSGVSGLLATNISGLVPVSGAVSITGGVSGSALGNIPVNQVYLPVSGVNFSAASVSIGAVLITGGYVGITGSPSVTIGNTAPIAISGVVLTVVTGSVSASTPNPLGMTGVSTDLNGSYTGTTLATYSLLPIGGRAVSVTGAGSLSGYTTGAYVMGAFNKDNGGLLVNQGILDQTQDNVTSWIASTGTSPLTTGVSGLAGPTFFGVTLPNNPARRAWSIVNLATGALMVKMSSAIPNSGNLDIFLKGASAPWAGDGAIWTDAPAIYTGPVAVSGFGGAPCVYRAWEL